MPARILPDLAIYSWARFMRVGIAAISIAPLYAFARLCHEVSALEKGAARIAEPGVLAIRRVRVTT